MNLTQAQAMALLGMMALTPMIVEDACAAEASGSKECNISSSSGETVCAVVAGGAISETSLSSASCGVGCYDAARSDTLKAAETPIDVWNVCRYVDNGTTTSIFVPFRSSEEWIAFKTHAEENYAHDADGNPLLTLVHCSRPLPAPWQSRWLVPLPQYDASGCVSDNPEGVETPDKYVRFYQPPTAPPTWPLVTGSYTCHMKSNSYTTINSEVIWTGLDADTHGLVNWTPAVNYGPDLTITASDDLVESGEKATLSWHAATGVATKISAAEESGSYVLNEELITTDAVSVSPSWTTKELPLSGSDVVYPTTTTTYTIEAVGENGVTSTAQVTIRTCNCSIAYLAVYEECPSSCGLSTTKLTPKTCTRSSDGVSVDPSKCSGQIKLCPATEACAN